MKASQRVILLVGSAKRPRSTSEALGSYLLERLAEQGFECETLLLHRALKSEAGREALLAATDRADLLVVAFPLYVDTLPYLVSRALELIAAHRQGSAQQQPPQRLLAVVNNGFPEAHQNETAIAICRRFAREAGFEWIGGLTLGGGGAINGQPLTKVEGQARHAIQALDLAAAAVAQGRPVPEEAIEAMARPSIPSWAYRAMSWLGWRQQARQHGVQKQLYARPYEP